LIVYPNLIAGLSPSLPVTVHLDTLLFVWHNIIKISIRPSNLLTVVNFLAVKEVVFPNQAKAAEDKATGTVDHKVGKTTEDATVRTKAPTNLLA